MTTTTPPAEPRERILKYALTEFASRGYEAASLARIAELADATKQNLLYHFGTKGALLHAVLEPVLAQVAEVTEELRDPESTIDPALAVIDVLLDNRTAAELVLFHLSTLPDKTITASVLDLFELVAARLAPGDPTAPLRTIIALTGMAYAIAAHERPELDRIVPRYRPEMEFADREQLAALLRQMTGTEMSGTELSRITLSSICSNDDEN